MKNCMEYQELISEYIDEELNEKGTAGLFFHLSSCTECRTTLKMMLVLQSAVRQSDSTIKQQESRNSFWHRRVSLSYPVAAAIMTAVFFSSLMFFLEFSQPPKVVEKTKTEYVYMTPFPPVYATIHSSTEFNSN